ncbi:MAG: NYN domain-containing protein [Streptococcaceae bacterium]|jgi:predicted RNA-binding protein with PIN domain|nr:NYN domain-containing protein [Streptococcaceae bacterium]
MKKQLLIVDGYNMIGYWPELSRLKKQNLLEEARNTLLKDLSDYAKFEGIEVVVVFDAMNVPGIASSYKMYQAEVIFTAEDETADSYIEKMTGERMNVLTQVSVATSDLAEQWVVFSQGALRVTAKELYQRVHASQKNISAFAELQLEQGNRRNSPWNSNQMKNLENCMDFLMGEKEKSKE